MKKYIQSALRLSLLYILFAGLWIIFSDHLLATMLSDVKLLTQAQTYKGWIFVIVTGTIIFFILMREFRARQLVEEEVEKHRKKLEEIVKERTEELSIASESLYRISKAVEGASDAIGITDLNKKLIYQNNAYFKLFKYTMEELNAVGGPSTMFVNQTVVNELFETILCGDSWNGQVETRLNTGQKIVTFLRADAINDDTGKIIGLIGIHTDLTERNRLEKEIARFEQLHLIGEMAAGIGHEIRNPMTTVRGFLQILMDKDECAKYINYFEIMIDELDRANSIITEYLSLAKNKAVNLKLYNLNTIVQALLPLIVADAAVSDHDIKIELEDIPDVPLDEKEIRQMIFNLVRNGLEAMSPGGYLFIKTFNENKEVVLSIKDGGTGIKPEVIDKIGTPFFTTKDQGTGLGLAVCYSIAARHNAIITIETGDTGTTFFVRFNKLKIMTGTSN